jgi:hypothetical protein
MASITFADPGGHTIIINVTDNYDVSLRYSAIGINVRPKVHCTDTNAKYYPNDTTCNNKWPNGGGDSLDFSDHFTLNCHGIDVCEDIRDAYLGGLNIDSCDGVEVCDESIDYMAADAEVCCNGASEFSPNPQMVGGYGYSKRRACDQALAETRISRNASSMSAADTMKLCKTNYLVHATGDEAIYMKDYYIGEICCAGKDSCNATADNPTHELFSAGPWPRSNIQFDRLWCEAIHIHVPLLFDETFPGPPAYASDTNPDENNNPGPTLPAHASVNRMNTGTCIDYSLVVTTALRKIGYASYEIFSVTAPVHEYNIVRLPGDGGRYSFIDNVGTTGGGISTGGGSPWISGVGSSWAGGGDARQVDHCDYEVDTCANDVGTFYCPSVTGC